MTAVAPREAVGSRDGEEVGPGGPPAPVLELVDVVKSYPGTPPVHALAGVNLELGRGEFWAILGASGSGKSTMLNVLGCLDRPTAGTYRLEGQDVAELDDDALSEFRLRHLGFIFQSFNLIPDLDLYDNVDVPLRYRGMSSKARKSAIEEALQIVGLSSRLKHLPSQLSGGQQQRVAVARALVGAPKLILADEPTGNLDSEMAGVVMDLLESINAEGTTIVMVTHDPELANRASRQIHLLDGKMIDLAAEQPAPLFDPSRGPQASGAAI